MLLSIHSASTTFAISTANVEVDDQPMVDNTIIVSQVTYEKDGWMVIHNDINGQPGDIAGMERVQAGINDSVIVKLDPKYVTNTMYAMLHQDNGIIGKWELTKDFPVYINGSALSPPFQVTGNLHSSIENATLDGTKLKFDAISAATGWALVLAKNKTVSKYHLKHGKNSVAQNLSLEYNKITIKLYIDRGTIGIMDSADTFTGKEITIENLQATVQTTDTYAQTVQKENGLNLLWVILPLIIKKRQPIEQ